MRRSTVVRSMTSSDRRRYAKLGKDQRRLEAQVVEDFFVCEESSVKANKEDLMAARKIWRRLVEAMGSLELDEEEDDGGDFGGGVEKAR